MVSPFNREVIHASSGILYVFSGLPGVGKTSLAKMLGRSLSAVYIRIDTIEQTLRDLYHRPIYDEGYRLAYQLAQENLILGHKVIADCVNSVEVTRRAWEQIASESQAVLVNIEVLCSDKSEHRRRIETRTTDIPGLPLPTWDHVLGRDYEPWIGSPVQVDTAGRSLGESYGDLICQLKDKFN